MTRRFYDLRVAETRKEVGGNATSVRLDVPSKHMVAFKWDAGQHLTLRFVLNGQEERRSYTISAPPGEPLRITVKRVVNGMVSNHIGDHLQVGDVVEAMPPFGGFTLIPGPTQRRTHYFFGAGSGITPLYSMIHSVLDHERHSTAHLVYGNSNADNILFKEELEALANAHADRFTLRHVLSSPSMWTWFTPWRTGRVDAAVVETAITETPPVAQDVHYWICGPGRMNAEVRTSLTNLDVPSERIHRESFGGEIAIDDHVVGVAGTVRITLDGTTREIPVASGQTILDAARKAGATPPFSCQSGVCGACRARLTEGNVHMRARMALEDSEISGGDVLTCQAIPLTERLAIKFFD